MPNILKTPFFRQETEAGCLPACAQMSLSHIGIHCSQSDLVRWMDVHPVVGAPGSRITRLRRLGVEVVYQAGDLDPILHWLEQGYPVIVFVQVRELLYWSGHQAQHALLVVGMGEMNVYALDPAQDAQGVTILRDDFMLAWDEMDNVYAVVHSRR